MRVLSAFLVCLLVFGLSACVVVTENPAGVVASKSKGKGWGGTWAGGNEVFYIDAGNSLEGEIEIFAVTGNSGRSYALKSVKGFIRKGEKLIFLNIRVDDLRQATGKSAGVEGWYVFVVEKTDDLVRLLVPDANFALDPEKGAGWLVDGYGANGELFMINGSSERITELFEGGEVPLVEFDELRRIPNRIESYGVREVTDLDRYGELVLEADSPWLEHFPENLEAFAEVVAFSHQPKFLQGGGWFQLSVRLPVSEVEALYERMMSESVAYWDAKSKQVNLRDEAPVEIPRPRYHASDTTYVFGEGFRLFFLQARPYRDSGFKWNHGSTAGVAINSESREVVYFAEYW